MKWLLSDILLFCIYLVEFTLVRHIGDVFALRVGHVAQVGEDHKAREEAGEGVDRRGHQAIPARLYVW